MEIEISDFIKISDRVNIIDIRNPAQYNDGHIENAINIDPYNLLDNTDKYLDIYKRYYIYCETGNGSKKLCELLSKKGYEVINIVGGFNSWIKWNIK